MTVEGHAVLLLTARVRPGSESAFAAWQVRHASVISRFTGFISADLVPSGETSPGLWTIILNFETEETLDAWRRSPERAMILEEVAPLLDGGTLGEQVHAPGTSHTPSTVTEVIFSKIRAGMTERYLKWAERIQEAQARQPGYRGAYLQPPARGTEGGHWTTILRFDSAAHLNAWMNSAERRRLLVETSDFVESVEQVHLATAFPGWVPIDPKTGKGPPNWKTALLVLLGLYPCVMLEMRFLAPVLFNLGIHSAPELFLSNCGSVAVTSFITMPLFVRWFHWWLFPEGDNPSRVTIRGVLILIALFAAEVAILWDLLA